MTTKSMNYTTLKLGFIGGAHSSAVGYTHWCASQLDNRWQVTSGCFSRDLDRSVETGSVWGLEQSACYSDWQRYIDEKKREVDAMCVLTPTPDHVDIVCRLLENNIPVICEKAMAASLSQSLKIKQALEKHGGFLGVTFNYSGYPMVRVLKKMIDDGDLGKLLKMRIEMPSDGFIQSPERMHPQPWRLQDGEIPTLLLDLGVHVHHLCGFLTGQTPASVLGDFNNFSIFDSIVDDAHFWVEYKEGLKADYWVSKTALGHRNGLKFTLYGDKASATWVQEDPEHLHIAHSDSHRVIVDRGNCEHKEEIRERFKPGHPSGFIEAFANLYNDLADCLTQFKETNVFSSPYVFGWAHAHEGLAVLDAASKANESKQWVSLEAEQ